MTEPKLCPDCKRPAKALGGCTIRGGDKCIRTERDNLRSALAASEAEVRKARGVIRTFIDKYLSDDGCDETDVEYGWLASAASEAAAPAATARPLPERD